MLEKIQDINLLQLAKDVKKMIFNGELKTKTDDYELELEINNDYEKLEPLKKLLEIMIGDNCLITELYLENKNDFKKCFGEEYSKELNEIFHSVLIKEIKVQSDDSYMGTLIYHEAFGEKMVFKLAFIRYLRRFQREENWKWKDIIKKYKIR